MIIDGRISQENIRNRLSIQGKPVSEIGQLV